MAVSVAHAKLDVCCIHLRAREAMKELPHPNRVKILIDSSASPHLMFPSARNVVNLDSLEARAFGLPFAYTSSSALARRGHPQPDPCINEILDFWSSIPSGGPPSMAFPTQPSLDDAIQTPQDTVDLREITEGFNNAFGAADREDPWKNTNSDPHDFLTHRVFFYSPLCHAEDLATQVATVALADNLLHVCSCTNAALGRQSTEEEIVFLREKPEGCLYIDI
ncbi:hypothetical protein CIB48_g333 [Xylaria polymorpha]|nr:hypothetical protein CIB48_g333 [Xylaria polymorpha]